MGKRPGRCEPEVQVACRNALQPLLLSLNRTSERCGGRLSRAGSTLFVRAAAAYASLLRRALHGLLALLSSGAWGLLFSVGVLSSLAAYIGLCAFNMRFATFGLVQQVTRISTADHERRVYEHSDLEGLPEPVQRYFRYALHEGQAYFKYCTMQQRGCFRLRVNTGLASGEGWKKVQSNQYFAANEPAHVWAAYIWLAPMIWVRGWEAFVHGSGHSLWRLLSAFTMVDHRGQDIDQEGLSRYLSEAVYFPTALLPSKQLVWQPHGPNSARVTLVHGDVKASGVFLFNAQGQPVRMTSDSRPRRLEDGNCVQAAWTGIYSQWGEGDGVRIPMQMESVWNLLSGPFSYAVLTVTQHSCHTRVGRTSMSQRPGA